MRRLRHLILLPSLLVLIAGCGIFGDKTPVEEPAELKPLESSLIDGRRVWRRNVGADRKRDATGFRVALDKQHVYACDAKGKVVAMSSESGSVVWSVKTERRLISGPGLVGDALVMGTLDGEVIAVHRDDGRELWSAQLGSEVLASPTGGQGVVVARTGDGHVFGLALSDGRRLWSFERSVPTLTLRGAATPTVHEGVVLVGLDNGKLIALSLTEGQFLWERTIATPSGRTELERLVDLDGGILAVGEDVYAVSYGGTLVALDLRTARPLWKSEIGSYRDLAVLGDLLLVSDTFGYVKAVDRSSGTVVWTQKDLEYRRLSGPVVHRDHIAVADLEGYLHWLSPTDGSIRGRMRAAGSAVVSSPQVVGGRMYVLDREGEVTAIEASIAGLQ